jgi:hypothetical protein
MQWYIDIYGEAETERKDKNKLRHICKQYFSTDFETVIDVSEKVQYQDEGWREGAQGNPHTANIFWSIVPPHQLCSASSSVPLKKYYPERLLMLSF